MSFLHVFFAWIGTHIKFSFLKADGGKQAKVQKLAKSEILMVNVGSTATGGALIRIPSVLDFTENIFVFYLLLQGVKSQT